MKSLDVELPIGDVAEVMSPMAELWTRRQRPMRRTTVRLMFSSTERRRWSTSTSRTRSFTSEQLANFDARFARAGDVMFAANAATRWSSRASFPATRGLLTSHASFHRFVRRRQHDRYAGFIHCLHAPSSVESNCWRHDWQRAISISRAQSLTSSKSPCRRWRSSGGLRRCWTGRRRCGPSAAPPSPNSTPSPNPSSSTSSATRFPIRKDGR